MGNQTILKDLFLSGLSDLPALRLPLFLIFLLIYLLTLIWNSLIIVLIATDSHLYVPMYFFLGNLAGLDLCCSSLTIPRMLFDLHSRQRRITLPACLTQVFFFTFCTTSEVFLLAVMSYDRYTAICQPLHYTQIMRWEVCVELVSIVGCLGLTNSLVHTLNTFHLTFCGSDIIESFFCDLPQLLQISCGDIYINVLLLFIFGGSITIVCLALTFLSYVYIFKTVLKIKVEGGRSKVFSTCAPHLTVMSIFYGSVFFNYFQLNESHRFAGNKVVSMFYTVILPILNPLIYSLRNQDIRRASRDGLKKILPNTA
ncbi:olfactory receptor 8G17-like [Lithobates pipiens]